MSISTSMIIEDHAQIDGRRFIRERHVDHLGVAHEVSYVAEETTDVDEVLTTRVARILEQLKQREIRSNIAKALAGELTFTFDHSTGNENLAALREQFSQSTKFELTTLAWVIHRQGLSDNQLRNLFGVTAQQLPALKDKLLRQHDRYEAVLAEVAQ